MIPRDPGAANDVYRQNTAKMMVPTLRRKRCACGAIVTAKQLVQQGGCNRCRGAK